MTEQTTTPQRFTLDETQARKWLERVTAIHDADYRDVPLPEGIEPARDGEDMPDIGADWDPLSPGCESDIFSLVNVAATAGIIGKPDPDTDVDFVYVDDEGGGYYFFVVYLGHSLKLATRSIEMRKLVDMDQTGVPAALSILDEAVKSANWALTHLDEYVTSRTSA
jgi:hypothetical protein